MVGLTRSQLRPSVSGVDITVMSARGQARSFAPAWSMVRGHKSGSMSDAEYTRMYGRLLDAVQESSWQWLAEQAVEDRVNLLCYCRDGNFCHTHLLAMYAQAVLPEVFSCASHPPEKVTLLKPILLGVDSSESEEGTI